MRDNGIQDRNQLAKMLNVGRSTVYSAFGPDWSGIATHSMLAAVAGAFDVSIATLAAVGAEVDGQRAA
ncbi:transcriptional repressor [Mycobacterium phage MarkPhew]|uniref:Helix-turn-helix DNA binding protein n=1 Tax=Mycobacterium phage MarkPhew TaxID=2725625 RepID=A0A6M3SX74_9CAUD|nr:transcriptional repressor [Mycobacterium phage MarkPhew]QJD50347.1 helix-turn-helix DNA binding protein [Mycobacterium phage MarkPhew]